MIQRQRGLSVQIEEESQVQVQTPVQVILARLLELPVPDLQNRIANEMTENPALENGEVSDEDPNGDEGNDLENVGNEVVDENPWEEDNRENYENEEEIPVYQPSQTITERPIDITSSVPTFYENLVAQLGEQDLDEQEHSIMEYLIGTLDVDGLMRKPLYTLVDELALNLGIDVSEEEVDRLLKVLQSFDPIGIGATTLQECFLLQLKSKDYHSSYKDLEQQIISQSFDDFANKRFDALVQRYKLGIDEVRTIYEDMKHRLNPRPGGVVEDTTSNTGVLVIPDFTVTEDEEGNFDVRLAGEEIPSLCISRSYRETMSDYAKNRPHLSKEQQDAYIFTKNRIEAAQTFINALKQRQDTMLRVMKTIVKLQKDFFHEGDEQSLHPMILRDVAERCGYDISTISRVSNSKYVETPFGIFPLKYFFNNSFTNTDGEEISKVTLKRTLKGLIDGEDKDNPLNDDVLAEMMKEKGFDVARRTIAKYRGQMGIPVARLRK